MTHYKLFRLIIKHYPLKIQEKWDQSRFSCEKKFYKNEVKRIFIMLDLEWNWFSKNQFNENDFLIVHHPIFTKWKNKFHVHAKQLEMLNNLKKIGVAILFMHTNFDLHPLGLNAYFASFFNGNILKNSHLGITIELAKPISLKRFVEDLRIKINPLVIQYDLFYANKQIKNIQILLGSGGSYIEEVFYKIHNVDLYISGDIKWHEWILARNLELPILDIHHSTEKIFTDFWEKWLKIHINNKILIKKVAPEINLKIIPKY